MTAIAPIFTPRATTIPVLRYLIAVADQGHFGRAAQACAVAQPTLSAQIAQWERRMKVQVFERHAQGARLTAQGERVVAEARKVLAGLRELEGAAATGVPPFFGPLRLGVIPTLGPYLLPLVCPALERAFPGLDLPISEAQTADLLDALDHGRLDALLLADLPGIAASREVLPLFDEPFHLAMPARHALAKREKVTADDLAGERLLLLDEGHCLREQALDLCRLRDSATTAGTDWRATSLETLRQLVALGYGLTVLPALAIPDPPDPRLAIRPLAMRRGVRTIALVWRSADGRGDAYRGLAGPLRSALPRGVVRPK
jgi:LysR family hydrogen peroxide-inducible transcriptional activator